MRLNQGIMALMLSVSALASASAMAGCAGNAVGYDTYRHDNYRWNRGEDRYYRQWEIRTHRTHLDFQRRSSGEQRAYWNWRHR